MTVENNLKKELDQYDRDKVKWVKCLINPRLFKKVYNNLCRACKLKAMYNKTDFCNECQKKFEEIIEKKMSKKNKEIVEKNKKDLIEKKKEQKLLQIMKKTYVEAEKKTK